MMQTLIGFIGSLIKFMGSPFWDGISAIALVITFFVIWKYTRATRELADVTRQMAEAAAAAVELQREEIGLHKRPVVSIYCADADDFVFRTAVHNFSMVHAKARCKATLKFNDTVLTLKSDNHYAGKRIWHLQAQGPASTPFFGHLDMNNMLKANGIEELPRSKFRAEVTLEVWVINYYENESGLFDDRNKNPISHWYWDNKWIPEIAPKL